MAATVSAFFRRRERPILLTVIGLLAIVVIGQAIVPTLTLDEDPTPEMTATSGAEVVDGLSAQGWACFESEGEALLQRCFRNDDHDGDASAKVTILSDEDDVAMVKAEVDGGDDESSSAALTIAAEAMDAAFLPEDESRFTELISHDDFTARTLPGDTLATATPRTLKVLNGARAGAPASTVYLPKALPLPYQLVDALEQQGFTCHSEDRTWCETEFAETGVSIEHAVRPVDPDMIEIRVDPVENTETAAEIRRELGTALADDSVGLTDAAGADFLAHGPETGHRGDFAGYGITVETGVEDESGSFTVSLSSVVPEATAAVEW